MAIQQCQSTEDKKSMANQSENASTVCHIHAHRHGQTSRRGGSKGIKHHLIRFISACYCHSVDLTCADAVLTATVVHCLLWSSSLCCPVSRRSLCWSTSAVNWSTVKLRAGLSSTSPRRHSSSRCCMKYNCSSTESSYTCQPVTPTTITAVETILTGLDDGRWVVKMTCICTIAVCSVTQPRGNRCYIAEFQLLQLT